MRVVISSGHGKYVRGAHGYIDEVDEARKVVDRVVEILENLNVIVHVFHDNTSQSVSDNLDAIVDYHNSKDRDLDVSVHFNAYEITSKPMGTEVLYTSGAGFDWAKKMVNAICESAEFINRGAKERDDLAFLNGTEETAILIETCFVDSEADVAIYREYFEDICLAIAGCIAAVTVETPPGRPDEPDADGALLDVTGKCSHFGGPDDTGVSPSEGLAFISEVEQKPELFLPYQPDGTSGLARRLNPHVHYIACRWDYDETPREMLRAGVALVQSVETGYAMKAFPADWGPNENTGRVADLSPQLMEDLKLTTDDKVRVIFPAPED